MSNWFRFSYLLEEEKPNAQKLNPQEIRKAFFHFSISILQKNGEYNPSYNKALDKFAEIVSTEYCLLKAHQSDDEGEFSMCAFFDHVKVSMLKLWETEIIQKSTLFPQ